MIYNLKGRLTVCDANFIVVECGGVGFKCFTSLNTAKQLAEIGKEVNVYTHLAVREDAMDLYAFATVAELDAFKLLITVSGIGLKQEFQFFTNLHLTDWHFALHREMRNQLLKRRVSAKKQQKELCLN